MAIDFPASPTNGQVYQGYYYDQSKLAWRSQNPSRGSVITSATTPTGASAGDMWFNSNDGSLYVYYSDGIQSYWTEIKANSSLNTTLGNRVTAVETGKANLSGGNTFSGNQIFNGYNTITNLPLVSGSRTGTGSAISESPIKWNSIVSGGTNYNSSTGLFTAPVAGKYFVTANVIQTISTYGYLDILKNGSAVFYGHSNHQGMTGGQWDHLTASGVLTCAVNDTISVGMRNSTFYGDNHNAFSIYFLG